MSAEPLSRCAGCGGWIVDWCRVCRTITARDATVASLEAARTAAQGRARRGALEAALPGTGYQHRPRPAHVTPQQDPGARTAAPLPRHAPNT